MDKNIWQTYRDDQIPEEWLPSRESIRRLQPDWRYIFMTDVDNHNFVKRYYPEYLDLYNRLFNEIKPICAVDMVRCLYLHRFGGVYLDMDYRIVRPLDALFEGGSELYVVKTPNFGGYTNSFMASRRGCRFWLECIDLIAERIDNRPFYIQGDLRVLWTTGPKMLTDAISKYRGDYTVIPYNIGHPCTICDQYLERPCMDELAYVEELQGSTWTDPSTQLFYMVVCRWKIILSIVLIVMVILITIYYSRARVQVPVT